MAKKAMILGLLGYIAGCIIGLCFTLQNENFTLAGALPQILLGGIPGAIAMGTTVLYDIEEWSLLRATVTHFLIVMGAMLLACFVLKWFEPWSTPFWIMLAAELVGYVIVWLIMCFCYKKQVRKLNRLLKENQDIHRLTPTANKNDAERTEP